MDVTRRQANILAERAFEFTTDNSGIAAQMLVATPATIAAPATDDRVDDDVLSRLQPCHVRCHRRDRAGRFVPEYNGITDAGMAAPIQIEIGMANRGGGDAHDHLTRFGAWNRALAHDEFSGLFENCRLHWIAPYRS
jgi:hypothetical protein